MSKIIRNLRSLEDSRKKAPLPPNLMGIEKDKKGKKLNIKILFVVLSLIIAIFLISGIFLYKINKQPNQKIAKVQNKSITKPITKEENKESEYIIPDENMVIPKNFLEEKSEDIILKTEPEPLKISKKPNIKRDKIIKTDQKIVKDTKQKPKSKKQSQIKTKSKEIVKKQINTNKIVKTESTVPILTEAEREKKFTDYVMKGDKAFLTGSIEDAIKWYEKALYLKTDIGVLNNLLSLYIQIGRPDLILKVFNTDNPPIKNENIISGLLIEMIKKGYTKQAKQIIEKTIKYDQNGYIFYAKGFLFEKLHNPILAFKYYELAYEKNKYDPYILYKYARFLEDREEYSKAQKLYKKILSLSIDISLNKKVEKRLKSIYSKLLQS